ncbi:MAG: glutathione S-transferase family protein [Sphingomonadaceae bacterium]|nr:glutathione S-transferase family protein [Sphingomonadaceae bacterium]
MQLFGHPFSSYTWKALIPLYENETPFEFRELGPDYADNGAELARRWPVAKFPLLTDGDETVMETTSIVEYLDAVHPGATRFIPDDAAVAREVRMLDRIFDNYMMGPMQAVVGEHLPFITERPDLARVARARGALDTIYTWLDARMAGREWAVGDGFTLADCAAAPSLFYADWVHPNDGRFPHLSAYRARLLARPSVARCVNEARPYRSIFPLGAPDRD